MDPSYTAESKRSWAIPRRITRSFLTVCILLSGFTFLRGTSQWKLRWRSIHSFTSSSGLAPEVPVVNTQHLDPLDPSHYVKGPPTESFHDNLLQNTTYITSWLDAGFTNDVMTYANMIYLGLITSRIPIVGPFVRSSHTGAIPSFPFGDVFDLPRLRKALNIPILEWRDVKDPASNFLDVMGCWSVWLAVQKQATEPRGTPLKEALKLDISYTEAPSWIKMNTYDNDPHSTFWALAALAFPEEHNKNVGKNPLPSEQLGVVKHPSTQLACYDYMYYVGAANAFEYERDYSPSWRYVMQHMRWTKTLEDLADSYIRYAIGVPEGEPTPPYIAIHSRHSDFNGYCGEVPLKDCFASLPVLARRVKEVQQELLARKGLDVTHVIMTSDESDLRWWRGVANMGWLRLNQKKIISEQSFWHTILFDVIVQSNAAGFVGTSGSTMSLVASRRVETWHDGAVRMVRWGRPDSDDH